MNQGGTAKGKLLKLYGGRENLEGGEGRSYKYSVSERRSCHIFIQKEKRNCQNLKGRRQLRLKMK